MKNHVLFWMKSNRGTNIKHIVEYGHKVSGNLINEELLEWAERQPCWNHGDNIIDYGYKRIVIPERKELLKQWDSVCKKFDKIKEERDILQLMLGFSE